MLDNSVHHIFAVIFQFFCNRKKNWIFPFFAIFSIYSKPTPTKTVVFDAAEELFV